MSDIPLTGHPGPLIRRLRLERDWTLRQLGEASGRDFAVISRVELAKCSPTYDVLRDLLGALGYEVVLRRHHD